MFRSSEDEDTDTTISESETNVELAKSSLTDENELVSDPEIKTGTIVKKDPLAEPISFAQISKTSEKSDSSDEESEHQDPQAQIESGLDLPDAANEELGKMKKVLNIFTEDTGSKCTVIFKSGCSLQEKVFIEKFITNIDKVKLVLDGVTVSLNDMVPSEANSQSVLEFFDGYSLTKNVPATFMF